MKTFILLLMIILSVCIGCKAKEKTIVLTVVTVPTTGTTLGKVSHLYRETGCATVVIVSKEEQQELTLIPIDTLLKEYDTDGMEIYFNYRTLKVKNPAGCSVGIPAMLTDISKK
ncbi:MAG: hypothetical protein V1904_03410 [Bacteroidota bacterium]